MNALTQNFVDMVTVEGNKITTTSVKVAEYFEKPHKDVLKAIRNLECSPEFTSAHFFADVREVVVGNGATVKTKFYRMTKDGFMFLVMSFTGKKAAQIKEAYINAFNWMHDKLNSGMQAVLDQYRQVMERERLSFQVASDAGRSLNKRKYEKQINRSEIKQLESLLVQPDLFDQVAA